MNSKCIVVGFIICAVIVKAHNREPIETYVQNTNTQSLVEDQNLEQSDWIYFKLLNQLSENYGRIGVLKNDGSDETVKESLFSENPTLEEIYELFKDDTSNNSEKENDTQRTSDQNGDSEEKDAIQTIEKKEDNSTDYSNDEKKVKHTNNETKDIIKLFRRVLNLDDDIDFIDSDEENPNIHDTRRLDIEDNGGYVPEVDIDKPMLDLYDYPQRYSNFGMPTRRAFLDLKGRSGDDGMRHFAESRPATTIREQPLYRQFPRPGNFYLFNNPATSFGTTNSNDQKKSFDQIINSRGHLEFTGHGYNEKPTPNPDVNAYPYEPAETRDSVYKTLQKLPEAPKYYLRQG